MNENNQLRPYEERANDEIDLRDIILPLWQAKYIILIVSVMFAGLVLGYHLTRYAFTMPSQYTAMVNFNFEGVEKGIYPNGSKFSPNDLLSANVIRRVCDEFKLIGKKFDCNGFGASLSIKSGFTGTSLLKQTAAEIASKNKNITVEDFNMLVDTYTTSIKTHSLQSAVLTLDNGSLTLGQQQAEAVLLKIPEIWAKYSIQELGVMNTFGHLITIDVTSSLKEEPLVMANKLEDYKNLLSDTLDILLKQPRVRSIFDAESGLSLVDLSYRLKQINKYQISTIRSVVTNDLSYSYNIGLHESFRTSQLESLKRERGELKRLITVYDDIRRQSDQSSLDNQKVIYNNPNRDKTNTTIYSPQYGDVLVSNLLEIGAKMADPELRKQILKEKIDLAVKLQKIETEIQIFDRDSNSDSKSISKDEIRKYIMAAGKDLDTLKGAIQGIVRLFNSYAFNNTGSLYFMNSKIVASEGYSLNDPKVKLKVVIGFILGGMIAVFWIWGRRLVA